MDPVVLVEAFNDAIGRHDLVALTALMTDDHRFVDGAGVVVSGRADCTEAWRGFFTAFPDYQNLFSTVTCVGGSVVEAVGHAECSAPELCGPARWYAVVGRDRLAEWRVEPVRAG